jgi:uncharacterized membrane protein YdjX (TVP38/TMEM64 family)
MKTAGLRKVRWIAFALAALGILQTPFVVPRALSLAIADHRLIATFVAAFAIRVLFIGFLAKIWWDTRENAHNPDSSNPKKLA